MRLLHTWQCRQACLDEGLRTGGKLLQEFELRTWSLLRFPFRIFHFSAPSTLNVIAVEHERRSVTASMLTRVKRGN